MAIEAAFALLSDRLRLLKEAVDELQMNVSGGYQPENSSGQLPNVDLESEQAPPPVVWLSDKASELEGAVGEAQHATAGAARAVRHPRNLVEAQVALIAIQGCLNGAMKTYFDEVAAHDTVQTLIRMGRREGGKWPEWVALVKTVIESCRAPLHQSAQALSECWQELAEKLAANSISVTATNIGHQFTTRENQTSTVHKLT